MARAGVVRGLWRYPVKSMQGEALESASLRGRGIPGDRGYAVIEVATGHVASAKHPRKWAVLFACRAVYAEEPAADSPLPPLRITLPDGRVLETERGDADAELSRVLGRAVVLATRAAAGATREANRASPEAADPQAPEAEVIREEPIALAAPAGSFFDYAVLHLLTTATLARLAVLHPTGRIEPRRFRPNVLVETPTGVAGFLENDWIGRDVVVGEATRLHAIDPCPRCVVTTLAQDGLPKDPGVLRTLARNSTARGATQYPGVPMEAVAGLYAGVLREGPARLGDAVTVE